MKAKQTVATEATTILNDITKVVNLGQNPKDLRRVLTYFENIVGGGTTLMCMIATGVLRNSITWYVDMLMRAGVLQSIKKDYDPFTGHLANFYSADKSQWKPSPYRQLSLFENGEG